MSLELWASKTVNTNPFFPLGFLYLQCEFSVFCILSHLAFIRDFSLSDMVNSGINHLTFCGWVQWRWIAILYLHMTGWSGSQSGHWTGTLVQGDFVIGFAEIEFSWYWYKYLVWWCRRMSAFKGQSRCTIHIWSVFRLFQGYLPFLEGKSMWGGGSTDMLKLLVLTYLSELEGQPPLAGSLISHLISVGVWVKCWSGLCLFMLTLVTEGPACRLSPSPLQIDSWTWRGEPVLTIVGRRSLAPAFRCFLMLEHYCRWKYMDTLTPS